MSDKKNSVLDVLARIEKLERKNKALENEVVELKSQLDPESWQELIIYRPKGVHANEPLEISWSEIDDEDKRNHYRDVERDVIGLVRKVRKANSNNG